MFFFFIFALTSLAKVYALECPKGKYPVSGHLRKAHYKSDGTYVSATTVTPHCRNYRNDGPLQEKKDHFFQEPSLFFDDHPWPYHKFLVASLIISNDHP